MYFFKVAVRTTWYLIPRIVQSAGVVRSVMTYGVFVELELKGGSTLWGFIAPEKLKRQHQSWRGEEGNLKAYVKKDALKLAQELKVRVLPTSAMSHFVCISARGKCLRMGHGDFNRKKYDSDHGISFQRGFVICRGGSYSSDSNGGIYWFLKSCGLFTSEGLMGHVGCSWSAFRWSLTIVHWNGWCVLCQMGPRCHFCRVSKIGNDELVEQYRRLPQLALDSWQTTRSLNLIAHICHSHQ